MTLPPWARLAKAWPAWEQAGLAPDCLDALAPYLRAPVLVVGAGQGLIVEALAERGLAPVGIDACPAMIRAAYERRGIRVIAARAQALPFRSEAFGSVLVTSGVLCPSKVDACVAALSEAVCVAAPAARVVAALFLPGDAQRRMLEHVGVMGGACQHQCRLADIWLAARTSPTPRAKHAAWAALIARWTGVPDGAARARTSMYRAYLEAVSDFVERGARRAGGSVDDIRAALDYELTPITDHTMTGILDQAGCTLDAAIHHASVATLSAVMRRRDGAA